MPRRWPEFRTRLATTSIAQSCSWLTDTWSRERTYPSIELMATGKRCSRTMSGYSCTSVWLSTLGSYERPYLRARTDPIPDSSHIGSRLLVETFRFVLGLRCRAWVMTRLQRAKGVLREHGFQPRWRAQRRSESPRRGLDKGPIDEALEPLGLERQIATIVGGFSTALALARASDLIASVPERHTGNLRAGMHGFPLPVSTPEVTVSLLWHPRLHADLAHRWLRGCVRNACAEQP